MNPFQNALKYLYSFISYERETEWRYSDKTLNLERFRALLHRLEEPQDSLQAVHVAGSDGKGSVCAMTASVLREMGYKVGLYVSPHLENIRERISINGQWISEEDFTAWTAILEETMKGLPPAPGGYATFFELLTAMAFLHFRREKVDYAVIETGLGGRLDATNVMNPLLTAITHISLEHTDKLGNTLEAIADEKLGITRPPAPVVVGHQDDHLLEHFHDRLRRHPVPVIFTDEKYRVESHIQGRRLRTLTIRGGIKGDERRIVHIPLLGHYQLQNTLTTMAILDVLKQRQAIRAFTRRELDRGLRNLKWAGRFEIFRRPAKAPVILDVAHTAKGAASLRLSLDEMFPHPKRIFVLGFLKGKDIRGMVRYLLRPGDQVIITHAPSPRGESVENILREIEGLNETMRIQAVENPAAAFLQAESGATRKEIIVVCGSLYLVGEIRRNFFSRERIK